MVDIGNQNAAAIHSEPSQGERMRNRQDILIAAGLAIAILMCYAQVGGHAFVNYDDHRYITQNPRVQQGLTLDNIAWAFTTFEVANWHPLTWMSHMVDIEMFGVERAGLHHLENVLIHIANTVLLFGLLRRMMKREDIWRCALVAAVFAVHPLRVESVAWVSERKDVLSVFFGLLTMHVYIRHATQPSLKSHISVAALFACSLMCKPMLVTLPALLLLLDYWPLGRCGAEYTTVQTNTPRSLILEKIPLLALSLGSAAITVAAQRGGGAVSGLDAVPIGERIINAAVAYVVYIRQLFVPVNLAPLYPLPEQWPGVIVAATGALLLAVSAVAIVIRRKRPELLVGWLWYLGTLIPVIGLVQVGSQAHADRYTYFPMIGLLIMIVWMIPSPRHRPMAVGYGVGAGIVLGALMWLTWNQTRHWRNSIALSEHTLRVTTNNGYAHFNLANAYMDAGRLEDAVHEFQRTGEIMPQWPDAPFNMGNAHAAAGHVNEAVAAFDEALRRDPVFIAAHNNKGIVLAQHGRLEQAIESFMAALAIDPNDATTHLNLGQALMQQGNLALATVHFQQATTHDPTNATAHLMLGNAQAMQDQLENAIASFTRSLELNPSDPRAHMSMASALASTGRIEQAIAQLNSAAQIAQAIGDAALLAEVRRRLDRFRAAQP